LIGDAYGGWLHNYMDAMLPDPFDSRWLHSIPLEFAKVAGTACELHSGIDSGLKWTKDGPDLLRNPET